jgi:hypothetical protein
MSILHVYAACLLHVRAAHPCCMSLLYVSAAVHSACPCCMSVNLLREYEQKKNEHEHEHERKFEHESQHEFKHEHEYVLYLQQHLRRDLAP